MIRIILAIVELLITRKVDSMNSYYQDSFITTLFRHFTAKFLLLLLPLFVERHEMSQNGIELVFSPGCPSPTDSDVNRNDALSSIS